MSEPEDQPIPGLIGTPTETGPASPGLPGLVGVGPAGSAPAPGELQPLPGTPPATVPPGSPPPDGGWFDTYMAGITGQDQGVPLARNLAGLMMPPGMTMAGGGRFRIDPELAPQAIADLKHAAQSLRDEVANAEYLANYQSPGLDAVSKVAVDTISYAAIGGHGSLRAALEGAAIVFEEQANNLAEDLRAYLQVDSVNIPAAREIQL